MSVETVERSDCTGCKMCGDICPVKAIDFEVDKMGFWYPRVNKDLCTNCGLCTRECPICNKGDICNQDHSRTGFKPEVMAAWSKDEETRLSSTSGGVFYEIGKYIIELGGVVVGCIYNEDWKGARHFIAHDIEGLERVKGSKYFQSDTEGIYLAVKNELEKKQLVLFCGTPCQNKALMNYLGKEYENLYYLDFICRSINSPLAFKKYLEELEVSYDSRVKKVNLKNKRTGWQSLASYVLFENGKESHLDKNQDWWVRGFIENDLYTRDACFNCRFRKIPRTTSDITIGDFWKITGETEKDMFNGISFVMINTPRGKDFFDGIRERLVTKRKSLNSAFEGNPALTSNFEQKKEKQEQFFELLNEHTFSESVKQCIKKEEPLGRYLKRIIMNKTRIIRDLYHIMRDSRISTFKWVYYNYFSRNVIRRGIARIIPYKNTILELDKTSQIRIYGDRDLVLGLNKLKRSKAETHIRLGADSVWNVYHGGLLFYNTVVEVKSNAEFNTGFFSANGGSVIVVDKKIEFGEDVMLGRNVIIYDSDFHQIRDKNGNMKNPPETVTIEDHVWITGNSMVLKGVTIGVDSLVTAYTVVNKDVPPHSIVAGDSQGKIVKNEINWNRERVRED